MRGGHEEIWVGAVSGEAADLATRAVQSRLRPGENTCAPTHCGVYWMQLVSLRWPLEESPSPAETVRNMTSQRTSKGNVSQTIMRIVRRYVPVIRLLPLLLVTATLVLGVFWYRDPRGNYEPLIYLLATLAALVGAPTLWEKT